MRKKIKEFLLSIIHFIRYKKSYAQDGEDVVLMSFYDGLKKHRGFFVDVGAHHPVRFSNTWAFYRRGWKGINIDPTPNSMRKFKFFRPRDINLEIGVGQSSKQVPFYCFNDPALNTFNKNLADQRNSGKPYKITSVKNIDIKPLNEILSQYLSKEISIDFITIDVEGLDLEVLTSNDWTRFPATFILVEDTNFLIESPEKSEIYQYLSSIGYVIVALLKRTVIYKRQIN